MDDPFSPSLPPPVPPPRPNVPVDRGLPALGLLMQFGAGLFVGLYAVLLGMALLGPGHGDGPFQMAVIATIGLLRSGCHWYAGAGLTALGSQGASTRIWVYVAASVFETGVLAVFAEKLGLQGFMGSLAVLLLAWPATLAALQFVPGIREALRGEIPAPDDKGFEGLGSLMLLIGISGGIFLLVLLAQLPSTHGLFDGVDGVLLAALLCALAVRAATHVYAGMVGREGTPADAYARATRRYVVAGYVSAAFPLVWGGVLMARTAAASQTAGRAGASDLMIPLMVGMLCWIMALWPLAVASFLRPRRPLEFSIQFDDARPALTAARDRGLTWVGWLLLALSVQSLAGGLTQLAAEGGARNPALMFNLLSPVARPGASWLTVLVGALQLWTAVELLRMTGRIKLATAVYGLGATVVTIVQVYPVFSATRELTLTMMGSAGMLEGMPLFGGVAIALVVPVGTAVLTWRRAPA